MILPERTHLSKEEAHRFFLTDGLNFAQPWGKLYHRSVFFGITYPQGKIYEDISVITSVLENAKSVIVLGIPVYRYCQSTSSISQTNDVSKHLDGLKATLDNYRFYQNNYPELSKISADAVLNFAYYLLGKTARSGIKNNKEIFDYTVSVIKETRHNAANRWMSTKIANCLFSVSPVLTAKFCQLYSYLKNGL